MASVPADTNHAPGETLLLIEKVKTDDGHVVTFWDNGSTISLVARSYVRRKRLPGVPISYDLTTVGGVTTTHHTTLYIITIVDREGKNHLIKAFEIEEICGELKRIRTDKFARLFLSTKPSEIRRPHGRIEILIGSNNLPLHPSKDSVCEGLVLFKSLFGRGKVLGGSHCDIRETDAINSQAHQCAHARVTNVRVAKDLIVKPALDFITTKAFGVEAPRRCNRCMNCKEFEAHQLSRENQRALGAIRDQLSHDPIKQVWTASYPCQLDPSLLNNNKSQAVLLAEKSEKRLLKDATAAEKFNEEFLEFIDKGILTKITPEKEASYQGPVYYVNAHEVYKPDSISTPIRIVINSSLKYKGLSPNDIWVKGPNTLNDMYGILLRLRFHRYALIGDIKKMYTNIRTTEKEKHMRRVLWRFTNTKEEFTTYAVDRVMFGDKPAAAVTSVAIRQTANIYKNISEEASQKIIDDTYVDDVTTGTDIKENIPSLKRDISAILEKGGMEMKGFVASGDSSPELVSLLGSGEASRVLGVQYDPDSDTFSVIVRINISKKYRGVRTAPDLTYDQIPELLTTVFTRRICQGIVYSCYDIYGLVTPITIP